MCRLAPLHFYPIEIEIDKLLLSLKYQFI